MATVSDEAKAKLDAETVAKLEAEEAEMEKVSGVEWFNKMPLQLLESWVQRYEMTNGKGFDQQYPVFQQKLEEMKADMANRGDAKFLIEIMLTEYRIQYLEDKIGMIIGCDQVFKAIDTDNDNIVTIEQLKEAWSHCEEIEKLQDLYVIKFIDDENEGHITREKWRAFIKKIADMDEAQGERLN